jgi:hypothetical protein
MKNLFICTGAVIPRLSSSAARAADLSTRPAYSKPSKLSWRDRGMICARVALAALCATILATVEPPGAHAQATTGDAPVCVQTAQEYVRRFNLCLPVPCLNPNLYGSIYPGAPGAQPTVYPAGFTWGWVSGYENLQAYHDWKIQACQRKLTEAQLTRNILLYVGFPESSFDPRSDYTLSVMDLGQEASLFVPTWEAWFQAFQTTYGLQFPLSTQKGLTLYDKGDDPARKFADISGCSASAARTCSDQPLSACHNINYFNAATKLKDYSPYLPTRTTGQCVEAFKSYLGGRPPDAAEARAMLFYCEDVNPCNSGVGFGFNPAWPPVGPGADGDPMTHYTGREFVLRNQSLDSLGAEQIRLSPPPPAPSRGPDP